MPRQSPNGEPDRTARLMLVLLSLGWGASWPAMRIALSEIPPFSMRVGTMALGVLALGLLGILRRRSFAIGDARAWMHLVGAALFNIVAFSIFTPFAQLSAATTRVTILVYTMPIWACLMARLVLGERITPARGLALALCAVGMAVLIAPLATAGVPGGIVLALGAAICWAAGTVYLKWARFEADPLAITFWQVVVGLVVIAACLPAFEGPLHLWPIHLGPLLGLVFAGLVGSGLAYFLWFEIVQRLPAMTASLGVLSVPAVGIGASVVLLGERPTLADLIGFALILLASACVLLAPGAERRRTEAA
jgi:drug/metabolite transporter (DMT)-like permease